MIIQGTIQDYDGKHLVITAPFTMDQELVRKQIHGCEIRLEDGRSISAEQRKKIYATFRDISLYTGFVPEEVKEIMKCGFIARTGCKPFSLSDTDMTTARIFLEYLIDFCLEWDIPTNDNLLDRAPDIARYVYMCLRHKKCCITQKRAELHHVDVVGMGRNRKDIIHKGYRVMPLTRKLHTEAHTIGQKTFEKKYHVFGVRLSDELCKIWKIKSSEGVF